MFQRDDQTQQRLDSTLLGDSATCMRHYVMVDRDGRCTSSIYKLWLAGGIAQNQQHHAFLEGLH